MNTESQDDLDTQNQRRPSGEIFITLGVIMATHNRALTTRKCLESLLRFTPPGIHLKFFVHDDGSTDQTVDVIRAITPKALITQGTGTDYWAKSMAIAERRALQDSSLDVLLWMNDDVVVTQSGFARLLETYRDYPSAIVVGVTADALGNWTYGGLRKIGPRPLQVKGQGITEVSTSCDTFHGNSVLVPIQVAHRLGGIDGRYPHAYADIDYGLRATRAGIPVVQMAGIVGECFRLDSPTLPRGLVRRIRFFNQPKHFPFKAQVRMGWKFGGAQGATLAALGFIRRVFLTGQ